MVLWVLGFGVQGAALAAGHVKAGIDRVHLCEACHGLDGRSKVPEAPNLSGQVENYLIEQLRAFKAGTRHNEMMSVVVQGLSPQDIEDLAAYFSSIEVTIGKLPSGQ
jgi:cytochrome c553